MTEAAIKAIMNLLTELGYSESLHVLWPTDRSTSELFALLKQRKGNGVGGALVRLAEVLTDGGESENLEESFLTALKFGNEQASDDLVIAHVLSEKMQSSTIVCTNPEHDHITPVGPEGATLTAPIPMLCNDCNLPSHYDQRIGWYQHDDGETPDCSLIKRNDDRTPCIIMDQETTR